MSSLVAQMGGLGELCSLRKLTLIPGIALEGIMETDTGWSGGCGDGLELSSLTPATSASLVRSRPREEQVDKPYQPSLAPEETSGDRSQVLSAEKGALRTWLQRGCCGHNSYKRSCVSCSLQAELCCGIFCSSQRPLHCALSVPIFTGTERSTDPDYRALGVRAGI